MSSRLKKLYEDREIMVIKGLTLNEIQQLVLDYAKKRGTVSFYELRKALGSMSGEDRLRRALRGLVQEGKLIKQKRIYYTYAPDFIVTISREEED
jgi:predicted HTH transcriptional regulator